MFITLLVRFARLISYGAGGFARGLTGGLALSAAALCSRFLKIRLVYCFDVLHIFCSFRWIITLFLIIAYVKGFCNSFFHCVSECGSASLNNLTCKKLFNNKHKTFLQESPAALKSLLISRLKQICNILQKKHVPNTKIFTYKFCKFLK